MDLITNGRIWTGDTFREGILAIDKGKIFDIFPPEKEITSRDSVMDAENCQIFPGGVDLHAHIQDGAETFFHGSCSAVKGGITTVMDMPPFKTVTNAAQCEERCAWGSRECISDFGLTGGIVIDQDDLSHMDEIRSFGVHQFKVFMLSKPPSEVVWAAVKKAAELGMRLMVHMEEPALLDVVNWSDPFGFPRANPPAAENVAVAQLLEMAYAAGAPIHVCHVSSSRTVDLINTYKVWGVDVTAETTLHYLLLNEEEFLKQPERVVVTPALRSKADNAVLWEALENGLIGAVVSDHFLGALPDARKSRPSAQEAEPGIAGLEMSMPLLFSQGVAAGRLSIKRFVEAFSTSPANIALISSCKGKIEKGMDADLVLFNPEKKWIAGDLGKDSRVSTLPYEGWTLTGYVEKTFVRGRMVWDGKEITTERGWGEFIPARIGI